MRVLLFVCWSTNRKWSSCNCKYQQQPQQLYFSSNCEEVAVIVRSSNSKEEAVTEEMAVHVLLEHSSNSCEEVTVIVRKWQYYEDIRPWI